MLKYANHLKSPARRLRKDMTEAEQRLWSRLRRRQISETQFYRQKPIGPYIVDFYAPALKLVIEIDGSQHAANAGRQTDEARDRFLRQQGLQVLRFNNLEVLQNSEGVLMVISRFAKAALNPPCPPFEKGGRRGDFFKGGNISEESSC